MLPDQMIIPATDFAMVPRRAGLDQRLKGFHHRVLNAVCGARDNRSGIAVINQKRIAQNASIARQKVGPILEELENWGYLSRIKRGRTRIGRFRVHAYEVIYGKEDQIAATCEGDKAGVTSGGDLPESPPKVADSYPLDSYPSYSSYTCRPRRIASMFTPQTDAKSANKIVCKKACNPSHAITDTSDTNPKPSHKNSLEEKQSSVDHWEVTTRNNFFCRLDQAISEAFPKALRATALDALDDELLGRSQEIEFNEKGNGVTYAIAAIKSRMKIAKD